jgi:hypothetical protein
MAGIDNIGRIREAVDALRSNIGTKPRKIYYVDSTNGNNNYDGRSRDHPVHSINTAIALAGHGDIIHIARDNYDEAVSIPAGKNGLQIICEPGVYLVNTVPGTVVAIASDIVYWEGGIIETNGQIGMAINGNWFHGKDIRVYNCTTGFDLNSAHPLLENCRTNETSVAGFDISNNEGYFIDCACHGSPASRGFYLSHTNAHNNVFKRCTTVACTAAGYECVAGADENIFDHCTQSSLCSGPTNAGANNTFASHSENSQILAGNTLQDDLAGLNTRQGRQLFIMDFWSVPQEEVALTAGAGDKALPDVSIAGLPAGTTIVRACAIFKFRMVENTNAGVNKLNGAQAIQVRDDTPSAWIDAINFLDDQFGLAATTREGGDVAIGAINLSATVDGIDTYNFQWHNGVADVANLQFNDVQVGLRIWYSI